jgi:hypothetical protein
MRIKELITTLTIVALLSVGCDNEPKPENPTPDKPTPEEGIAFEALYFDGEYYGDYYDTGLHNWTFALCPLDRVGDHIQFDIMTDSAEDFLGTYSVGDASTPYSFLSGYIDGEDGVGYLLGSWYYTDDGITMAAFVSGTLNIEDGGSGKISVRFDVKDDRDNALYGRWIGYATEIE